ncbi:hypothetical protein ROZALSC1DRAFT_29224 [Rozella allomycis CSF55]|uniref:Enhancer of polycomb-like protein n=1 Tax=Rozella allomycis (strain CSF55) TaxID=988480 RepID=A0A075ANW1_ROZAC|nr:Enhancer of polycomb-like domain-containing protein [Rozella allomycis CSF55]RKP19148.1 hypothetical protein ROZALSC1DRAFT_29224 [Rozella allomycis CSF55]|eukprot:EPZ31574.1 Enhancer of polycomb-like domain-containing protein [Rozella allomycis CSF55]
MERKPKFRSRKIDIYKALPAFCYYDVPDLDESASISRALPLIPTGVDKDEEEEHHLQQALASAQINSGPVYIPTPSKPTKIANYDILYRGVYKQPKTLVRFNTLIEDCVSIPYDMDDDDENWLNKINKDGKIVLSEDAFEMMMNQFEKASNERSVEGVNMKDLEMLMEIPMMEEGIKNFGDKVFEYWKEKRNRVGKGLIYSTKLDEGQKSYADPYVCFRRREIKIQRKTRRSDSQSLEKLKKLRTDLETAKTLLEMVCKRDKFKKESLMLESLIFEQSLLVDNLKKKVSPQELEAIAHLRPIFEKKPKTIKRLRYADESNRGMRISTRKEKALQTPKTNTAPSTVKGIDSNSIAMTQNLMSVIDKELMKKRRLDEDFNDTSELPFINFKPKLSSLFYSKDVKISETILPNARYRLGRNGRVWIDEPDNENEEILGFNSNQKIPYQIPSL